MEAGTSVCGCVFVNKTEEQSQSPFACDCTCETNVNVSGKFEASRWCLKSLHVTNSIVSLTDVISVCKLLP